MSYVAVYYSFKTQKDIEVIGEAKNGFEAVELVESLQPDIVLMDLVMPEMDGIQANEKIKDKNGRTLLS